ncbi:angiopoietin-2-like [Saccostrea cucullata]|uniref:angiopoietin-2-like n=1 Tax=Saccostrea cuccullata TaxID=36930 RepID=UPI002ED35CDC
MYDQFSVSDEPGKYQLFLAGPATGTLAKICLGCTSPPQRDNDGWSGGNCADTSTIRGGWWFTACNHSFLNGPWPPRDWSYPWSPKVISGKPVRGTTMMIRRH